ncbi:MAG: DUF4339 domain-containing protein [Verrucomicrobiota bacterium]
MEWYYSADGSEQQGPITEEALVELIKLGQVTAHTQVWCESMKSWEPLSRSPLVVDGDWGVCAHSGRVMERSLMAGYGENWIDPDCKDDFVQSLMEQGGRQQAPTGGVSSERVEVFANLSRGIATTSSNFWPIIGISFLNFFVQMVVSQLSPLNVFAQLHLIGGINYYLLRNCRRQKNGIEDSFTGFSRAYVPILLIMLIIFGIVIVVMIAAIVPIAFVGASLEGDASEDTFLLIMIPVFLIMGLLLGYLQMIWYWAPMLAIEKGMKAWASMELSRKATHAHFWPLLGLFFMVGVINLIGALCLLVGLVYTLPMTQAALMHAYDQMFRDENSVGSKQITQA